MKRDIDLVRQILTDMEDAPPMEVHTGFHYDGYDTATVNEHIELLIEAGLLEGKVARSNSRSVANVTRLTWAGHDFIQSMVDESIWKKAKEQILKPGVSWTFELLSEWAKHEAKQRLGIPDNG
jgi:hypothetical protein